MARDEFGMPLPGEDGTLPWSEIYGVVEDCDGYEICQAGKNSPFITHAANNIIECREIVRELAKYKSVDDLLKIVVDAQKLWSKMQEEQSDASR